MTTIHLWLWLAAVALVVATGLVALGGVAAKRPVQRWTDWLLLLAVGALLLAVLGGPLLVVAGHRPADPLHLLYAGVAVVTLPIARLAGRDGSPRRRAGILVVGCLVLGGVLARLFATGG